jgi:hypothetical protein
MNFPIHHQIDLSLQASVIQDDTQADLLYNAAIQTAQQHHPDARQEDAHVTEVKLASHLYSHKRKC